MQIYVQGHDLYAYTGGRPFDAAQPTVVLIHGVLCDHSVWALQSRYLAHHGWNVLAVDLPGHHRSAGMPPDTVESAAQTMIEMVNALQLERVALTGHSWGSLIALETASRLGTRASHLAMIGTAYPMRVSAALLDSALNQPEAAMHMVQNFSRSTLAPPSGAGSWVHGAGMALGRRLLERQPAGHNLFHNGFLACDRYANGEAAMSAIQCPVLMILGEQDQMTPAKAAQPLQRAAAQAGVVLDTVTVSSGHNQMSESPDATLDALYRFLQAPARGTVA